MVRGQFGGDGFGLDRRHHRVVEPLQQQDRAGEVVHVTRRRPLGIQRAALRQRPDEAVQVPGFEVVRLRREPAQVADAVVGHRRREDGAPFHVLVRYLDPGGHGGQGGPAPGRVPADAEPLPVRLARLGQRERGGDHVGHVDHAPLAAQPLPVGPAVPARTAVVHVDDPDAPAGEERLLQVEPGDHVRGRAAVHPHDVGRQLALGRADRGVGRRVDQHSAPPSRTVRLAARPAAAAGRRRRAGPRPPGAAR